MTPRSRFAFAIAVAATLAIGVTAWARLPHGGLPSLSFDSFRYLAGAYSIRDSGSYRDIDGTPQRVWPPGTSAVYAGLSRATGRAPEDLSGAVGITSYLITILALALALAANVRRASIASVAIVALGCNSFIVSMTNKLWSDPPALACFSIALALLVVPKPSLRTIAAAAIVIAIGVAFRYAMIAALLLPVFAAWRMRLRWFAPAVASCLAVMLIVIVRRVGGVHPLPLGDDLRAFETLSAQLVPGQLGLAGLLIAAIAIAFSASTRHHAAAAAGVWIAGYIAFLFVAQAIAQPSFTLDLRILIPLYPAIVLAIAVAADALFDGKRHLPGAALVAILLIGGARALHGLVPHPDTPATCMTREQIVGAIRTRRIDGLPLSSNAQGLVWYALRRPVRAVPKPGDLVVVVDPARVCEGIAETAAPDTRGTRVIVLP